MVLLLVLFSLFPLSAKETEEWLAIERTDVVYATSPVLGVVVEPPQRIRRMMQSPYGLDWLETYVDPQLRQSFARVYGDLLASILPAEGVLYGSPKSSGPYALIPVRLGEGRYLTLCMKEGFLVSISSDA